MEPFLKIVAEDLYSKFGAENGLADVTVVFPNRRARLFFDDNLSSCCTQPVWSPGYTTIEELFRSQSDLRPADRIEMVTLLHKIYQEELHSDESLDSFWSWGELMLADFDVIIFATTFVLSTAIMRSSLTKQLKLLYLLEILQKF